MIKIVCKRNLLPLFQKTIKKSINLGYKTEDYNKKANSNLFIYRKFLKKSTKKQKIQHLCNKFDMLS